MYIQRYLLGIYAGYLIDAVCVLFVQYSTQCDFYSTFSLSIFIRFYRIFDNMETSILIAAILRANESPIGRTVRYFSDQRHFSVASFSIINFLLITYYHHLLFNIILYSYQYIIL